MRGWALVWQHWKLSVCLLVSPTVQCACETSTLCHHCFFVCACVLAKARMEKAEQIKEKKKEKKNVKHEEERVRVTVALWYTAASLALTMHCVEVCVFICSSGGIVGVMLWTWRRVKRSLSADVSMDNAWRNKPGWAVDVNKSACGCVKRNILL